jgi:tetrahydromethanopterin S-methyltransferase subunit B
MLSNNFWYGFILGLSLVAFVAVLSWSIARLRSNKNDNSK